MTQQYQPAGPVNQFGSPVLVGAPSVVPVHPGPARTDPVSVWALVLSIVFWPAGLVLSIIGMVRTGRGLLLGRGLAVAGLVISLVQLMLLPVLAAIAIPTFLNQRQKAVDLELRTDLVTAGTAMELGWMDLGTFPTTLPAEVVPSPGTELFVVEADAVGYCLQAVSGDRTLFMDQTGSTYPDGCP